MSQGTDVDQDGNEFQYLAYGDQDWAVENPKVTTYRDGTPIQEMTLEYCAAGSSSNSYTIVEGWPELTVGAYVYVDIPSLMDAAGVSEPFYLYNLYAVLGIHDNDPTTPNKEFAPEGWRIPSKNDFEYLEDYLIANGYNYDGTTSGNKIAKSLASQNDWLTGWFNGSGWTQYTDEGVPGYNSNTNNSSGFNGHPITAINGDSAVMMGMSQIDLDGSSLECQVQGNDAFRLHSKSFIFGQYLYTFSIFSNTSSSWAEEYDSSFGFTISQWNEFLNTGRSTRFVRGAIQDNVAPTINAPSNIEFYLESDSCIVSDVNLGEAQASDDSGEVYVSNNAPAEFQVGETIVTWSASDVEGNLSTDTQVVTIVDDTPPTITAPSDITVSTNDSCTATGVTLGDATTSDNCSVASVSNDAPAASFSLGITIVTWTATDASGNSSTDTQIVDVVDTNAPNMSCNDISLTLENGIAVITALDLDNGSADNCGGDLNLEINQTEFNESHIGDNIVVLTGTDQYGNSSTCQSTVTIEAGMGIDDNTLANISLYPNPSSDLVFIKGANTGLEAVVFDLLGKQVMREFITDKLDISCLEKGTYIINLTDGINTSSHKIIKN